MVGVGCVILAAAVAYTGAFMFYYPRCKKAQTEIITSDRELKEGEIRVMSCNLKCLNPSDLGKKSWFYRAEFVMENINAEYPGIIGFQECTKYQYPYLCESLPEYDSVITYRDKAIKTEGCPVFYRKDLFTLVDKGSFWLSETPEKMSKDWDAACYRICSYVILKENSSGKEFAVFNAHLDHVSDEARINGINVVLDKISEFGGMPSILMGDLNAQEASETYAAAMKSFDDTKYLAKDTMDGATYQMWGQALDRDCIDYVLVSKNAFTVNQYKIVETTYDGIYPSDHFPLSVSLELN